jgi:hypothetical protein
MALRAEGFDYYSGHVKVVVERRDTHYRSVIIYHRKVFFLVFVEHRLGNNTEIKFRRPEPGG